ncbi:MAG: YncE family protein [Clostridium sp.]|nr:YncE family protein [Clostridium sp.]
MDSLIVCNTGSDDINKISLVNSIDNKIINKKIALKKYEKPLGPNGIFIKENIAYIANCYNNSISIFNLDTFKEVKTVYIGANPNDIIGFNNNLYIICSESNTMVIYDIEEEKVILEVKTNSWPYNIEISKELKLLFISNFQSHNITVIDIENYMIIDELIALEYPTKVKVSKDGKTLYVCESYMDDEKSGYIEMFDLITLKSLGKIKVGKAPVDIFEDNNILYVCNFLDGSIMLIDKDKKDIYKEIKINGMPRTIIKHKDLIYISDYLNGRIFCIDLNINNIKAITVGKEPNAMTLY